MNNNNKYNNKKIEKIFERCLKLIGSGCSKEYCLGKYNEYKDGLEGCFDAISHLKNIKKIEPDDKSIKSILGKIYSSTGSIEEHSAYETKSNTAVPYQSRRASFLKPAMVFITIFVVVIFSFTGTIYASQGSLPGENLYPVKRTAENIQLFFYPEVKKGQLHFKFLNNRIYEAGKLMGSGGDSNVELVEELLGEIDEEYRECKRYDFFKAGDEEDTLAMINNVNNRYRKKYQQYNRDIEEEDSAFDESSGNEENIHDKGNTGENGKNRNKSGSEK